MKEAEEEAGSENKNEPAWPSFSKHPVEKKRKLDEDICSKRSFLLFLKNP
jgi:hypothetical protein